MALQFTADFFKHSRTMLRTMVTEADVIVVTANGLLQASADSTFPFRQDSSFWYLTGINQPDITLVMDGRTEYLIVPGRSDSRQAFDGMINEADLTKQSGITSILNETYGWQQLSKRLATCTSVATLQAMPSYVEQHGMYTNPARASLIHKLKDAHDSLQIMDIRPSLASLRAVKRPLELEAIQEAIDTTIGGLQLATSSKYLHEAHHEYDLEALLSGYFRRHGSTGINGHAFTPIVAAGKNACTLHNIANNGPLQQGDLVVLDVGSEAHHYAADISRTIAIGEVSKRHQEVHAAVVDIQTFAMELLKPGALVRDNEAQIESYLGEKLQSLGLLTKQQATDHEAIRHYYPHSASHFLGLDVHDIGDYGQPLAAGMVLTCEPGIYIPEEGIGVRIEDDVLITETGHANLSAALTRTLSL